MTRNPSKAGSLFVPTLLDKPQTRVKCPIHTDRVIHRLRRRTGSKELLTRKRIRTLYLMRLPQRPRLYHLVYGDNI